MRKQELLHLHGLLAETADYLETSHDHALMRGNYEALGTKATAVHASKTAHKQAVFALLDAMSASLAARSHEPVTPAD